MKPILLYILVSIVFFGCSPSEENTKSSEPESLQNESDTSFVELETDNLPTFDYADTLVEQFIQAHYPNKREDSLQPSYLRLGMTYYRDQEYLNFRVGLDLGFRFQTDYHLYIDTASKSIYRDNLISSEFEKWQLGDLPLKR